MKRVAAAVFSKLSLLARNLNRKISINQNMAAHSQCVLTSGAVQHRYYCNNNGQTYCLITKKVKYIPRVFASNLAADSICVPS